MNDNHDFCISSDAILTKYSKANFQIAQEQASYFIALVQEYYKKIQALQRGHGGL